MIPDGRPTASDSGQRHGSAPAAAPRTSRSGRDPSKHLLVGQFTYHQSRDAWTWSDGMFHVHGFSPREVVPTTRLVMHHIHPDDRPSALESRASNARRRGPFSFRHRIVDARGRERVVVAVGSVHENDAGVVMTGHLVDVTDLRHEVLEEELDVAVARFAGSRATIEQAKGVLMQVFSIDAETAWDVLRVHSQVTNEKVRDVAVRVTAAATDGHTPAARQPAGTAKAVLHALLV